jgi:general secretion pathway protein G
LVEGIADMNMKSSRKPGPKAFTLIEMLLVITIISVLAAVVVPRFFGRSQDARIAAVRQTISGTFGIALDLFEQDTGRYPRSDEGLRALIDNPQVPNWRGPYLKTVSVPLDPWGNEYKYSFPSELTSSEYFYDIVSGGPDGSLGGEDDITNHDDPANEIQK